MTLDEYLRQQATYAEFAATVVRIIEAGLTTHPDVVRPLTSQSRAKDAASLRAKLTQRGLLDADNIETEIKDFAGCRLIFYTNSDADRFLQSRIVFDNFVVDWDNTKIHHAVGAEPKVEELYRARHYIISMKPERLALPEYARFAGMRAELQIQTLLNHAWSETAHDIIYKNFLPAGLGAAEMEAIKRRMARIMTKYLVPAGYEFQKVQHDAERLRQGKALFERGPIKQLEKAPDNNERCDTLERLSHQILPLYDEVPAIHGELLRAIPDAILAARRTQTKSIEAGLASFPGRGPKDVTNAGVEILTTYRYVDVEGTFLALCRLWDGASEEEQRSILAAVERLAEHNIEAWRQVGCGVQAELLRIVCGLPATQLQAWRPIIVSVCQHALEPTVRGVTSSYDAATFHARPVVIDDALKRVRGEALGVIETLFKGAGTDDERRAAFSAMMTATTHPSAGKYGEDAISLANGNSSRVVRFVTAHSAGLSFELLQHVEHALLLLYRQSPAWFEGCREDIKVEGEALKNEIRLFRDAINADRAFVTHKTLVGFEAVFPHDWETDGLDVAAENDYRLQQVNKLVGEINPATAAEWLAIIKRCAATESNDGATFLTFVEFLKRLARAQPAIVLGYLKSVPTELERFLNNLLAGLDGGTSAADAQALMRSWVEAGTYLPRLGRHLRLAPVIDENLVRLLATKAIATANREAVIETLVVVVAHKELAAKGLVDDVFIPAVRFLTQHKDVRWLYEAWYQPTAPAFFAALQSDQVSVVLDNIVELWKIDAQTERVIAALAKADYDGIWHFFGRRFERKGDKVPVNATYEAVPHQFFQAQPALGQSADRAVDIVRGWYKTGDPLFQFRGGRLVAIAFPACPPALSDKLIAVIAAEGEAILDFVADILVHYHGGVATHSVCQAMVDCLAEDDERLQLVRGLLQGTGVVSGEFGMVKAYQQKVAEIEPWQNDPRSKVRAFALAYTKSMQQSIAAEHGRSEQNVAMRKLEWDKDLDNDPFVRLK
jgi:ppGpp synthetase/RelA/SpoT-type nucleotidyltranferase